MRALGIDIGTTSICVVCYDDESGRIEKSMNRPNSFLENTYSQDPDEIFEKVMDMLREAGTEKEEISAIGVCAQMHGILYVDERGRAVSPYFTWKDESGNAAYHQGRSYAGYLEDAAGFPMHAGYGTATHFYRQKNGLIPKNAVKFANIGDYIVMRLTGRKTPLSDESIAAGFGGFDLEKKAFALEKLSAAGVDVSFYPELANAGQPAGFYNGIPTGCAWGDNQASFYGAVGDNRDMVSVNVGTGSQVSLFDSRLLQVKNAEVRPYPGKGYLYVGASLNGGKVYERLGAFWNAVFESAGLEISIYDWMERIGGETEETSLVIEPALYGARGKVREYGSVRNMTADNFQPSDFIRAYVRGMAGELYGMYESFPETLREGRRRIAVSGNGLRKNVLLQQELGKLFGMPLVIRKIEEEAAAGAAMLTIRILKHR